MIASLHAAGKRPSAYAMDLGSPVPGREEFLCRNHLSLVTPCPEPPRPLLLILPGFSAGGEKVPLAGNADGFVERAVPEDVFEISPEIFARLDANSLYFSFGTPSAYSCALSSFICRQIRQRVAWCGTEMMFRMETALHEAVSNAVIHGNLGIDGADYDNAAILIERPCLIEEALGKPELTARRVDIFAAWDECAVNVSVSDQGRGLELGELSPTQWNEEPLCGMGLNLIAKAASSLYWEDGGRTVVMSFKRS